MGDSIKIGVTGASGILGQLLCQKSLEKGFTINSFSKDIRNKEDLAAWINNANFDIIIHFAAVVPVNIVENDPSTAFEVNTLGALNLIESIKKSGYKPWLFYASTSHVYKSSKNPLKETDLIDPINTYGFTKYIGEQVVKHFCQKYSINYCIGRIFSFYHETQQKPFLYPSIKARLQTEDLNKPFVLKGANSVRDILPAESIIDKIFQLINKRATGIYNIGKGEGIQIRAFVQSLSDFPINIINDDTIQCDTLVADMSKFQLKIDEK